MLRAPRRHLPFLLLLLLAAPLTFHFAASDVVSTLGDDSVSYLVLARQFAGIGGPTRDWVGHQVHFGPLLPLALALTGGAENLAVAHTVVAVFAVAALVPIYRYANLRLGSSAAAAGIVLVFLLTPSAWISIRGILSESLYLLLSFLVLFHHATRLEREPARARDALALGALLACAYLTRGIALTLVAAYYVQAALRIAATRRGAWQRLALPAIPLVVVAALWMLVRPPSQGFSYGKLLAWIVSDLTADPGGYLKTCAQMLFGGWIRSFNAGGSVHGGAELALGALGLLAIAGAVRRARRNRLDGWYVLFSLAVIFLWRFPEDNARRLLYPLLPLLLIHAVELVLGIGTRVGGATLRKPLLLGTYALVAALCLPAWILVLSKSADAQPIAAGSRYAPRDITEYYTAISVPAARADAVRQAAVLEGLEALRQVTPPGSTVMWVRPDYVATLGGRKGTPWYYQESLREVLARIVNTDTGFVVVSVVNKTDMNGGVAAAPPFTYGWATRFSRPVYLGKSPLDNDYAIAILEVDRAASRQLLHQIEMASAAHP